MLAGSRYRTSIAATIALAASVAVAAGTSGVWASSATVAVPPEAATNASAAQADAASLLTQLSLPSGATQSASEPAGDSGFLAGPPVGPPVTPNAVNDHAWWLVPGSAAEVLRYVMAHHPPAAARTGSGSAAKHGVLEWEYGQLGWPAITGVLGTRQLVVGVVQLSNGSTALRVDAQVVWVKPRPVTETIPRGARLLRLSVRNSLQPDHPTQQPFNVTSPKKIEKIVALLNALPAAQPGLMSCPNDAGFRVGLTFYTSRGVAPLAVAKIDPEGCGGVQLAIGGKPQPPLTSAAFPGSGRSPKTSLIGQLESALGVKLKLSRRIPEHDSRPDQGSRVEI